MQKDSAAAEVTVAAAQIPESADVARNVAAMLEAIEAAGYRPSKLEGPGGTSTSKPQS